MSAQTREGRPAQPRPAGPDASPNAPPNASPNASLLAAPSQPGAGRLEALVINHPRLRRLAEILFWVVFCVSQAIFNSATTVMDLQREGVDIAAWEPRVWEWTSNLVLLLLVPGVVAFQRKFPLYFGVWRKNLPWHVLASVVFCLVHVGLMVAARKGIYLLFGSAYDFGDWPRELVYEYLKDWRSYAAILTAVMAYGFMLRRLQGEAALLSEPDAGPAFEPVAHPERFLVKKLGKEFLLPASEIEWVQSWGNYVNLHLRGRDYPLRSTLTDLEKRLDEAAFVRVHRSYLVRLEQIEALESEDGGDAKLLMKDGMRIPCSRTYRERLRSRLV
jgi:DNA-binding LytR/AlgR family response regulator